MGWAGLRQKVPVCARVRGITMDWAAGGGRSSEPSGFLLGRTRTRNRMTFQTDVNMCEVMEAVSHLLAHVQGTDPSRSQDEASHVLTLRPELP